MKILIKHSLYQVRLIIAKLIRAKTVGVRALVIRNESEVLLVKHTYRHGWHTPGGGVDPGETPINAIERELFEEVGIKVKERPILFAVYLNKWQGLDDYPILYIVRNFIEWPSNSPEIREKSWFDLSQLPEDITEKTQMRLREYFEEKEPSTRW